MEIININGMKQFILNLFNFLINMIIFVVIMIISNVVCFDYIEYSNQNVRILNILMLACFVIYVLFQNLYVKSFFYFFSKYKVISCMKYPRLGIFFYNLFFYVIMLGSIVTQICDVVYVFKLFSMIFVLIEIIPCFMKKYSKSLTCYIFKIITTKKEEKDMNDRILLEREE